MEKIIVDFMARSVVRKESFFCKVSDFTDTEIHNILECLVLMGAKPCMGVSSKNSYFESSNKYSLLWDIRSFYYFGLNPYNRTFFIKKEDIMWFKKHSVLLPYTVVPRCKIFKVRSIIGNYNSIGFCCS